MGELFSTRPDSLPKGGPDPSTWVSMDLAWARDVRILCLFGISFSQHVPVFGLLWPVEGDKKVKNAPNLVKVSKVKDLTADSN